MRRAGRQRLLLTFVRHPSRQRDDFECRRYAAVGLAELALINLCRPEKQSARHRYAAPLGEHVASAHRLDLSHKGQWGGVRHPDKIAISDRKGEASALQQAAEFADVGKGRDARGSSAEHFVFRQKPGFAQFFQRFTCEQRGEQQPVGLQRPVDLNEGARQIVDELQR